MGFLRRRRSRSSAAVGADAWSPTPSGDPDRSGSRFTSQVAIAASAMRSHGDRWESAYPKTAAITADALRAHLGTDAFDPDEAGQVPAAVDGSVGRGAASWIPVLEWTVTVAIGGVIGNAAWDGLKAAGRRAAKLLAQARDDGEQVFVSRGLAAILAASHILETTDETGILDTESVVEPSAMLDRPVTELSYGGFEPWLVLLLNEKRDTRYLVAVAADGQIEGAIRIPMTDYEQLIPPLPPRS